MTLEYLRILTIIIFNDKHKFFLITIVKYIYKNHDNSFIIIVKTIKKIKNNHFDGL